MPQPTEVVRLRDQMLQLYQDAWNEIERRMRDLAEHPPERVAVLRRQLAELSADIRFSMQDLNVEARGWIQEQLPLIYAAGGAASADTLGGRFRWAQHDRAAVQQLAGDTFSDLLAATKFVNADTKRFVRDAARAATRRSILEGVTPVKAGRDLAVTMQRVFGTDPIAAVVYSNGARHSLADYASTVVRTKSAEAYSAGTFSVGNANGVEWYECFDGPDCGLTTHDDSNKANGQVMPADVAQQYPLAHPRCARTWSPRPDIASSGAAKAADRFTPEQRAQMAEEERARAADQPDRLSRSAEQRRQAIVDRRAGRLAR